MSDKYKFIPPCPPDSLAIWYIHVEGYKVRVASKFTFYDLIEREDYYVSGFRNRQWRESFRVGGFEQDTELPYVREIAIKELVQSIKDFPLTANNKEER